MQNLFHKCPACGGRIIITECQCEQCRIQMRGYFHPGRFSTLSEDELAFIRVFLRARGNLSEVERVLGISYPTIRNKLDEINNNLGIPGEDTGTYNEKDSPAPDFGVGHSDEYRKDILKQVADGRLTPREAVEKLEDMSEESK